MTKYVDYDVRYCLPAVTHLQSLNVVENDEFRNLLLVIQPMLRDKDIPRRTKLRELVLQRWKEFFNTVKRELLVSFMALLFACVLH